MNNRNAARPLAPAIILGSFLVLLILERICPLRRRVQPTAARIGHNLTIGGMTALALLPVGVPVTAFFTRKVEQRGWGLVPRLPLSVPARKVVTLLLMDYTLYVWHVLLHRVPLLWRCHLVHHADLDLDATTAIRFHVAEFMLSIPWRVAQIMVIGVSRDALALWQRLTLIEVMFHHSNLRLPLPSERWLSRLIVTPRLHGIHHSIKREERDSNFSSGLTVWDFMHRSIRTDVPQQSITIGLPGFRRPDQVTLGRSLLEPLRNASERDPKSRDRAPANAACDRPESSAPAPHCGKFHAR